MAIPGTQGKNTEGPKSPGGKFSTGTGGHTSRGVVLPPNAKPGSTSTANTRLSYTLSKRMHGAGGTNCYPA